MATDLRSRSKRVKEAARGQLNASLLAVRKSLKDTACEEKTLATLESFDHLRRRSVRENEREPYNWVVVAATILGQVVHRAIYFSSVQ